MYIDRRVDMCVEMCVDMCRHVTCEDCFEFVVVDEAVVVVIKLPYSYGI